MTTSTKTPSQRGAANRRKGASAELSVVKYLRTVGFGGAERAVRTGYRTSTRTAADPGDITGTIGIVWSIKDVATEQIAKWFDELDRMDAHAGDVRLLVHKRRGHADPGRWWCWMRLHTLVHVLGEPGERRRCPVACGEPVRMELGHVIPLLHAAGYGDAIEDVA
jgi:hypothetical protein